MIDNEIIKALECCKKAKINQDCVVLKCPFSTEYGCNIGLENLRNAALDLINRQKDKIKEFDEKLIIQQGLIDYQKAEIERLNKNYEELIYKTECLLCHATGNKFSKYTYTIQEMLSFVDDYIQDCCDEAVEETKATAKSEAIKEFAKRLKDNYCFTDRWGKIIPISTVDTLVKEMTDVETIQRKEDEGKCQK